MRALDHRLPGQGRSQGGGGGEGVCLPRVLGTRGPMAREGQDSGGGNRNPHISHEICYETDKKARQGSLTLWPSGPARKTGPSDYQRPSQPAGALWTWGVLWASGALW